MDSLDFYRAVCPEPKRGDANDTLNVALQWVGANARPDDVFDDGKLAAWALAHGYILANADERAQACALLRQAETYVPHPSPLATLVHDFVWARDG